MSLRRTRGVGWAVLAVSSLLAVGLVELGLRALGRRPFDASPDRTVFWTYHPTLGWHHRPGQRGQFEVASRVEVIHNSRGLRDREIAYASPTGRKRVLVLGDSFAWGFGVEQDEVFAEQMESALENVEVINGGVSGYSTDQELLWLGAEGMRYRPDLVILLLAGNDDELNHRGIAYLVYPKPYFVLATDGELELRNVPVPRASVLRRLLYRTASRSALVNLLTGRAAAARRAWGVVGTPRDASTGSTEPLALTVRLVEEMREVAAKGGARFLVVATGMFWPPEGSATFAELTREIRRRGIELLDVEATAGFDGEQMRLPDDGHWNHKGHAFAAERAVELIERLRLLETGPSAPPPRTEARAPARRLPVGSLENREAAPRFRRQPPDE